jgi:hypothetical protein
LLHSPARAGVVRTGEHGRFRGRDVSAADQHLQHTRVLRPETQAPTVLTDCTKNSP